MADESILVKLGLKMDDFQHGLEQARKRVDSFALSFSKVATLGFGSAGIGIIISKVSNYVGDLALKVRDLSVQTKALDLPSQTLQGWEKFAGSIIGTERAAEFLGKLVEKIGQARVGESAATKLFEKLQVNPSSSRENVKIIEDFLAAVDKIQDVSIKGNILDDIKKGAGDLASVSNLLANLRKESDNFFNVGDKELESTEKARKAVVGYYNTVSFGFKNLIIKSAAMVLETFERSGRVMAQGFTSKDMLYDPPEVKAAKTTAITLEQQAELDKMDAGIRKSLESQLDTRDKIAESQKRINDLIEKGNKLKEGTFAFESNIRDIDNEIINNHKLKNDLAKEEQLITEKRAVLVAQLANAEESKKLANAALARSKDDIGKGTIADWAGGGFNRNRWHNFQVATARQVQSIEAAAIYRFQQTGDEASRDAAFDYTRKLRGSMSGLVSSERFPMESLIENSKKSTKAVMEIAEKLANAQAQ